MNNIIESTIAILDNIGTKEIAGIASGAGTFFVACIGLFLKWVAGRLKSSRYKRVKARLEQVGNIIEGQSEDKIKCEIEKIKEIARKLEELRE